MLDTSVLRDFHYAQILALIFHLNYELLTTDLIEKQKELEPMKPKILKQLGLKVIELPGNLVGEIFPLRMKYAGPSVPDLSALLLARHLTCQIVTRDGPLTNACRVECVSVRDTLWLLRKMVIGGIILKTDAADALEIMNTKRLRHPNPEWTVQIHRWRR